VMPGNNIRAVGGRTASLAKDARRRRTAPGPHGQKVGLVVQLRDQLQFVLQQAANLLRHAARIAPPRPAHVSRTDIRSASARRANSSDTRSATRRAKTCSDRQSPACAAAPRARQRRGDHFGRRFQVPLALGNRCGVASAPCSRGGWPSTRRARRLAPADDNARRRPHQRDARLPRELLQLSISAIVRPAVQFGQQIAASANRSR